MSGAINKWDLSHFPVTQIRTARENDFIYDGFGIGNADDANLTISINEKGIQEPLTLSSDCVLLSGHRRLAAAKYLRMTAVPIRAVEDITRPIQLGGGFSSMEEFVKQETENFLMHYSRNLMLGQTDHIEIMLEKNALRSIIEAVARDCCIPMTTGRGFSSLSPRYDMWRRFKNSGKKKLVLLMLTDFDPDGEQIAASFARSMRDDFGLQDIHPVKVALTAEDVRRYNLPSDIDAKPSSPNYRKFMAKYGTKAVELDAAPVTLLQSKLREAIESVIDVDEFNAQVEQEKLDAASVEAYRQVVFEAIKGAAA